MHEFLTVASLFAGAITTADLGAKRFHARESAYNRIASAMPWNLPAVFVATQASDPETAWRARRMIRAKCPALDPWRCLLAPGMWRIMTCDNEPDCGEPDVPALYRANNLIVPGQGSWTTPEMEIRWVWSQCRDLRKPKPKPKPEPTYFWNQ